MDDKQKWAAALADVAKGRKPSELAPIVRVSEVTVGRWLNGRRIPSATMWRALVLEANLGDRWAELSAARDAVALKPGRKRTVESRRMQAERLRAKADALEAGEETTVAALCGKGGG